MKKLGILIIAGLLIFVTTGCRENTGNNKLQVAVTIVPEKTFVEAVGGDKVEVVTMIPPGYSTANYAPGPKEYTKFSDSRIYFAMGVPADKANILPKAGQYNKNMEIVKLFEEVAKVYPDREFAPGKRDPHIWLSPRRVKVMIDVIAKKLVEIDSENRNYYLENASEYREKLSRLDREIKESLEGLENRSFIVYHPALGYFAEDYGLNMLAIEKSGKKATARRLEEIITAAKAKDIRAVFYQEEIDSRQSEALAGEIDGKTVEVSPLAPDYIENLRKTADLLKSILNRGD